MAFITPFLPRGLSSKFYTPGVKLSQYIKFTYWLDSQLVVFLMKKIPEKTILVTRILIEQTEFLQNFDLPLNQSKL